MAGLPVEFSGTISDTVATTTQRTFKGSGNLVSPVVRSPGFRIITKVAAPAAVVLSFSFALKFVFNVDLDRIISDYLKNWPPPVPASPQSQPAPPEVPLSTKLQEFGIDSYIVVVRECQSSTEAEAFEYELRQKRVYAKDLAYQSKHYVYIGPLYSKSYMQSILRKMYDMGYDGAYSLRPN